MRFNAIPLPSVCAGSLERFGGAGKYEASASEGAQLLPSRCRSAEGPRKGICRNDLGPLAPGPAPVANIERPAERADTRPASPAPSRSGRPTSALKLETLL
jgi:hypothetical protein